MIIWINGAFGAGKTSVSELLVKQIPGALIFDPEDLGYIIQKTFPPARQMDYQDLPMWRRLVSQFIADGNEQFETTLIIPMTLVVPAYVAEIFAGIDRVGLTLHHFFLDTSADELRRRITNQVIIESDAERDEEVRQWRLAQIDRCVAARDGLPAGTVSLKTDEQTPETLVAQILAGIR